MRCGTANMRVNAACKWPQWSGTCRPRSDTKSSNNERTRCDKSRALQPFHAQRKSPPVTPRKTVCLPARATTDRKIQGRHGLHKSVKSGTLRRKHIRRAAVRNTCARTVPRVAKSDVRNVPEPKRKVARVREKSRMTFANVPTAVRKAVAPQNDALEHAC